MERIIKNKLVMFLFVFVLLCLPSSIILTACEKEPEIEVTNISVICKNEDYTFTGNCLEIVYVRNLYFKAEDFRVFLQYSDESTEEITSGFTYKAYKDEQEFDTSNAFETGNYRLEFSYMDYSSFFYINIATIELWGDIPDLSIKFDKENYEYDANGVKPTFTLQYKEKTLKPGDDYTFEYYNNDQVGNGFVYITLIGSYSGTLSYDFEITALKPGEVVFDTQSATYTGKNHENQIKEIINKGISNVEGVKGYSYFQCYIEDLSSGEPTYSYIVTPYNVGRYKIVVFFESETGYADKPDQEFYFTVNPKDISDDDVTSNSISKVFKGDVYKATNFSNEEICLKWENIDVTFDISMGSGDNVDNLNASGVKKGKIVLTGNGNFTGTRELDVNITPYDFSTEWLLNLGKGNGEEETTYPTFTYDGTEQVYDWVKISKIYLGGVDEWLKLTENTDYRITYKDNINAGEAFCAIEGIGNYTGRQERTFTINKKAIEINPDLYSLVTTEVEYNGQEQIGTLLRLNGELPEQVEVNYYYKDTNDIIYSTINVSTIDITIKFTIKTAETNYCLAGKVNAIEKQEQIKITPFVIQNAIVFADPSTEFEGGTGVDGDLFYYTYSNQGKYPKVKITASLTEENEYTLKEGTDYTLSYKEWSRNNSWENVVTPKDAARYCLFITYSTNFANAFYPDSQTGTYYERTKYGPEFIINKKVITEDDISWPATYRAVWGYRPSFDEDFNGTREKITTNAITSEPDQEATFAFEINKWSNTPVVDDAGNINVTFESKNYEFSGMHSSQTNIVNVFTEFKINGVSKTLQELIALESFTLGDKLEIEISDKYEMHYSAPSLEYSNNGKFTTIVGTQKDLEGNYCVSENALITVSLSNSYIEPIERKAIPINRNIFSTFGRYYLNNNSQWILGDNFLISTFRLFDENETIYVDDELRIVIPTEEGNVGYGYTFNYDLVDWQDQTTQYQDKITEKTLKNDGTNAIKQVVVKVYNTQDDLILSLHYNFEKKVSE